MNDYLTKEEIYQLTLEEIEELEYSCSVTLYHIMEFKRELEGKPPKSWEHYREKK
jgi:hypothetical protein